LADAASLRGTPRRSEGKAMGSVDSGCASPSLSRATFAAKWPSNKILKLVTQESQMRLSSGTLVTVIAAEFTIAAAIYNG
jgi:hypothetical protein